MICKQLLIYTFLLRSQSCPRLSGLAQQARPTMREAGGSWVELVSPPSAPVHRDTDAGGDVYTPPISFSTLQNIYLFIAKMNNLCH